MEEKWCPRSDPVFELVPQLFATQITDYYRRLGSPPVSIHTFWDIYSRLLAQFQAVPDNDLQLYIDSLETHEDVAFIKNIERLPGQRDCHDWDLLVGNSEDRPPAVGEDLEEERKVAQSLAPGLGAGQEEIIALFKDAEQYRGYIDITDEEEGYIDVTDNKEE